MRKKRRITLPVLGLLLMLSALGFWKTFHLGSFWGATSRQPASFFGPAFSGLQEPCRGDGDCQAALICRQGWCRAQGSFLGEAGEPCRSGYRDCLSGACEQGHCVANAVAPAANGMPCRFPAQCRSGVCGRDGICHASAKFRAFPQEDCEYDTDCLSGYCRADTQKCGYGSNLLVCARIGQSCEGNSSICCSGQCSGNRCVATYSSECSERGLCGQRVGAICAASGQVCQNDSQCCSLRCDGGQCVQDLRNPFQPCSQDQHCFSGYRCSAKNGLCVSL